MPKDIPVLGKLFWSWLHYTDFIGVSILGLYFFVFSRLFGAPAEPLIFIGFILAIIYWGMDSRVSIALALACLVIMPILLILFNKDILVNGEIWAEQAAVWAYYFLVIGVVRQIFEYQRDAKKEKKKIKKKKIVKPREYIVDLRKK